MLKSPMITKIVEYNFKKHPKTEIKGFPSVSLGEVDNGGCKSTSGGTPFLVLSFPFHC